jgi:GNAT superfamily N-acetyltransferase
MQIRPLRSEDVPRVLAAWNQAMVHNQLSEERFRGVMLEDPNYEPEGLVVAEEAGEVCGFSACVVRRGVPGRDGGGHDWESGRGFLKGFFVAEGERGDAAAQSLLAAAEAYCAEAGKQELMATIYTGRHVFPGLDVRYLRLREVLGRHGYRDVRTIEDVAVDLRDAAHAARLAQVRERVGAGVELITWEPALLPEFRKFVAEGKASEWFPVGWEARYAEADANTLLLRRKGEIVGWARYRPMAPRAAFGPILVLRRERGQGYGLLLLLECMTRAREAGSEAMSAGWANTGFYIAAGWQIVRRYAVLQKDLKRGECDE